MNTYFYAHLTKLLKYTPQVLLLETLRTHAISIIFRIIYQLKGRRYFFKGIPLIMATKWYKGINLTPLPPEKSIQKSNTISLGWFWKHLSTSALHCSPESKFTQANSAWYMPSLHAKERCLKHSGLDPRLYYEWQYILYIKGFLHLQSNG